MLWRGWSSRLGLRLGGCNGRIAVAKVGERVFFVRFVFFGFYPMPWCGFHACHGCALVEARVAQVAYFKTGFGFVGVVFIVDVRLGRRFWLHRLWREAAVQLAGQVADFILALSGRGVFVDITQPHAQLQQWRGDVPAQTQAQRQGQGQQDGAENAHALQADGHRLLELIHVQADAQLAGGHILEGDLALVHALGFAQQAMLGTLPGLGENPVVHAINSRVGHQWVLGQVV
ncbi:hypothetical protein D3C78_1342560 [compost metagenome]